jgi:hypothetical protein
MRTAGFVVTFACFAVLMVIFRSAKLKKGHRSGFEGLVGLHGIGLRSGIGLKRIPFWILAPAFIALARRTPCGY